MAGAPRPYMYGAEFRDDGRFPETNFDPKAVTRQSWEPKPRKPKQEGPLLSVNRHPDAHMLLNYRSKQHPSLGRRTKASIKWLRRVQLVLRLLQLNAALGLLTLMILITNVEPVTHWILRIVPGVVAILCLYAIYHHSRDAAGRSPASTAAYQLFAGLSDLAVMGFYAFGAVRVYQGSEPWGTLLGDQDLVATFVPAVYYTYIGGGGVHLISLSISLWLSWAFRQITLLPPDMNPLEDHLTARPLHKRKKSSVSTFTTFQTERRDSVAHSYQPRDSLLDISSSQSGPTVPFMHTRTQSRDSIGSRNSQVNLPTRQYQIMPSNSPRNSTLSLESKRASVPRSNYRGSYAEVPLDEPTSAHSQVNSPDAGQQRTGKFTETWKPTDSLISRTNQRNREIAAARTGTHARATKSYSALSQRYNLEDSDSDYDGENDLGQNSLENDSQDNMHPNPLRSNPAKRSTMPYVKTPFRPLTSTSLTEINPNQRRVSASRDIADEKPGFNFGLAERRDNNAYATPADQFYSRPYRELKPATPPVIIGNNRKVSSGNDYNTSHASRPYERRNVSGKQMEEGRGGARASYYGYPEGHS
ncbi:hypothetical protein S40293_02897 [Stachybotrys chartarum IBT 40293]|nr:hypothetical protein S40293_02897 [Stachybotrys chartarum IBT 40293]